MQKRYLSWSNFRGTAQLYEGGWFILGVEKGGTWGARGGRGLKKKAGPRKRVENEYKRKGDENRNAKVSKGKAKKEALQEGIRSETQKRRRLSFQRETK